MRSTLTGAVLLDTSAYSALKRGHEEIAGWVRRAESVVVNAVVLGELLAGFRKGGRREENERELLRFLESPRVQVSPMVAETAERYAIVFDALRKAGQPIPINDVWIAATALERGLTLITTDVDFSKVPGLVLRCYGPT